MSKEIDDRLKQMRDDAEKAFVIEKKVKPASAVNQKAMEQKKAEGTKNVIDLDQFMDSLDGGSIVQIYKKKDKIIIETTPLFSKWPLYSLCINILLFVLLLTKAVGLW